MFLLLEKGVQWLYIKIFEKNLYYKLLRITQIYFVILSQKVVISSSYIKP